MSLLLDALNKADKERKKNLNSPGIDSRHAQPSPQKSSLTGFIAAVILAATVASVTSYLYFSAHRGKETSGTNPSSKTTSNNAVVTETFTSAGAQGQATSLNTEPNVTFNTATPSNPKVETTQKIADLYQQTVQNPPSKKNNAPDSTIAVSPATNTASINQFANIPELHDLPDTVLAKIPSMNYSEHHFNKLTASEQGGSIMINGSLKHVNDQLVNGVYLDRIFEDGIVLHFENYAFKMHALNSWVNM